MKSLTDIVAGYNEKSLSPAKTVFTNLLEYSSYVVTSRAIPSMKDGMKPVQRIAVWTIMQNGRGAKTKTLGLVGNMLSSGLYHHGDASATAAINMLAALYLNNRPFLTGYGAFGTVVSPKAFGAARYTSVGISEFSRKNMMVDEELFNLVDSTDGDAKMCENFLPLIPTVLLNGSSGMSIGFSTDILPHSVNDLKKAVIRTIDGKTVSNILPHFEKYDLDITAIEGDRLSYFVAGKVKIHNSTTVEIITNNPNLNQEKLKTHLFKLQDAGKIQSFEDQTSKKFSIFVKMKRSNMKDATEASLVSLFKLRAKMTERLVTIGLDSKVRIYADHNELLPEWTAWRFAFYKKRYEAKLKNAQEKASLYEDIIRCVQSKLPARLTSFKSKKELASAVQEICNRDRPQIVEMATYRWTDEEIEKTKTKLNDANSAIAEFQEIIDSEKLQKSIFKQEVKAIK